jgi:hypothetical protein
LTVLRLAVAKRSPPHPSCSVVGGGTYTAATAGRETATFPVRFVERSPIQGQDEELTYARRKNTMKAATRMATNATHLPQLFHESLQYWGVPSL